MDEKLITQESVRVCVHMGACVLLHVCHVHVYMFVYMVHVGVCFVCIICVLTLQYPILLALCASDTTTVMTCVLNCSRLSC